MEVHKWQKNEKVQRKKRGDSRQYALKRAKLWIRKTSIRLIFMTRMKDLVYKVKMVGGGFKTGGYTKKDAKEVKKILEKEHPLKKFKIIKELWYK